MNRITTTTLVVLAAAVAAAPAALAGPTTKTYTANAPMPDPSNWAGGPYSVCAQNVPGSFHTQEVALTTAGTLKVELKGYQGDWDLLLMNGKKAEIGASGSGEVSQPEVAQVKLKKAGSVFIVACNWAGGPTGTVTYTFTPAKKR